MGIDMVGPANDDDDEVGDDWGGSGQCDVLQLVVIDQNADTYAILPINRDTITAVDTVDEEGTYIGTSDVQIALAHGHGDGKEISCENTVNAVSNYLYGQEIDGYVALNIDSIQILNEMAGGVEVTIEDDFSQVDPSMEIGETITLTGEQAEYYVRSRINVADGTNENRMKRQSIYRDKLEQIYRQKMSEDETFVLDLYDALQDYMVTTFTKKDCSKLAKAMLKNESLGEVSIEGEITTGRFGYREFIPDADSLQEVIIQLFYEKV
jgi:anionic cell wall polymer biosynthesis LytR-Cps2A-Psr (LCP) family protein